AVEVGEHGGTDEPMLGPVRLPVPRVLERRQRLAGEGELRFLGEVPLPRVAPAVQLPLEVGCVDLGDAVTVSISDGYGGKDRATQVRRHLSARVGPGRAVI